MHPSTPGHQGSLNRCSYRFDLPDGPVSIHVELDRGRDATSSPPTWAALTTKQCPNCPLAGEAHCPAAVDLAPVVDVLGGVASVQKVDVSVSHGRRETRQVVSGEAGARAIMGLILATSACPILGRLRPLAHLHLPFASPVESTFRFAAAHLLRKYFAGEVADLTTLSAQMDELHIVNAALAARLKLACTSDAIPNAMTALFSLTVIVGDEADLGLAALRALFDDGNARPVSGSQRDEPTR